MKTTFYILDIHFVHFLSGWVTEAMRETQTSFSPVTPSAHSGESQNGQRGYDPPGCSGSVLSRSVTVSNKSINRMIN